MFWPEINVTKRDMLNYYYQVVPYMLPYIKDRPQTLNRFPNGIYGKSFYGWLSESRINRIQGFRRLIGPGYGLTRQMMSESLDLCAKSTNRRPIRDPRSRISQILNSIGVICEIH